MEKLWQRDNFSEAEITNDAKKEHLTPFSHIPSLCNIDLYSWIIIRAPPAGLRWLAVRCVFIGPFSFCPKFFQLCTI